MTSAPPTHPENLNISYINHLMYGLLAAKKLPYVSLTAKACQVGSVVTNLVTFKGGFMLLTFSSISGLTKPGRYTDDQTKGLHLWIRSDSAKYWIFRYTISGQRKSLSLGAFPNISLKVARKRAIECRSKVNQEVCPLDERKALKSPKNRSLSPLFSEFALKYIERMRPQWRNHKHAEQWISTIKSYAFPFIGSLRLDEIDTNHIQSVLMPIWLDKPETASRLRGRIESILSAAITSQHRLGPNPATWNGHLENLFPTHKPSDKHHAALDYREIPAFMAKLRSLDSISALALEFTILNASRTGEVLLGQWTEVDSGLWTIPASRMKSGKQHQVPLCSRSIEILNNAKKTDPDSVYFFANGNKPLSNMAMLMLARRLKPGLTVHGFRSTFRDWVAEETDHRPDVAEMALAHSIGNRVEAAYRRGKLLDKRKILMEDWQNFCLTGRWGNIINLVTSNQKKLIVNDNI